MFSREQASGLREEFWTTFGKYMSPVYSSEGMKISWINYHTGVKEVYFRMRAEKKSAIISISIEHRDAGIQELYFEQFLELKRLLHAALEEEWIWELHEQIDGKVISRIYKEISDVSIFNKNDWHQLIAFFKPRIIALDAFWGDAKYSFEGLK